MVNIQIVTNSATQNTKTYWMIKDENQFLPDGVTPNPTFNTYIRATLAQIVLKWTNLNFPANGTDPLKSAVVFGLEPFLDYTEYQVTISEGDTDYVISHDIVYEARTVIEFDVYFKSQDLAENTPQLENLMTEIQSIWMNYQNWSINGIAEIVLVGRTVDPELARQSATSNYKKTLMITFVYYVARTTDIESTILTYDDPDIAGAFRTN